MFKKIVLSILLLGFVFLTFFIPGKIIEINQIICLTQYGECPDHLNLKLQKSNPKNLSSIKKEINKILKDDFLVAEYSTQYKIPNTLKVNIIIRKAVFAINQKETSNYSLIDSNGWVVGIASESSLPKISTEGKLKNVGEKIDDREMLALNLIRGVFNMYQVSLGEVKNDTLTVALPGQLTVIFPLGGSSENYDVSYYLGLLRLILSKIESESPGKYYEIDLRFKNPVLR